MQPCLWCSGDRSAPDHDLHCDGRQGAIEAALENVPAKSPAPYEQDFLDFHAANPHVYDRLRDITRQVRRSGREHFGIRVIWERLRWLAHFETEDPNVELKLNDHYTRHYARLLMEQEPDLAGIFEVRDAPVRPTRREYEYS